MQSTMNSEWKQNKLNPGHLGLGFSFIGIMDSMSKKIELKTGKNNLSVSGYIDSVTDETLRKDAKTLLKLFKATTAAKPKMWGESIVGFGEYTYYRSNGAEGKYMATGFSIRKSGPTIYIMPGYNDYSKILKNLGPHKLGKSCLYLKNLEGIELKVIEKLIKAGLKDQRKTHEVKI